MPYFQPTLFEQPKQVKIAIRENHEFFLLTHLINWTALIALAEEIRDTKIIKDSGPRPHYRALLGTIILMALRRVTYREAEDLIAHYAPARYLCDLMDSDWHLDHVTIFEFTQMLGPVGVEKINCLVLKLAVEQGFVDSKVLMSDTTAQESMIPYPNEVGLMSRFMQLSSKTISKLGGKFQKIKGKIK